MSERCCQKARCGALLTPIRCVQGEIVWGCRPCLRNKAGYCRDCPAPLGRPRAMRCPECAAKHRRELARPRDRARYPKRRRKVLAALHRKLKNPAIREHKRRYMQAYRAQHPRDALDRVYGREYMRRRRSDPAYRAEQNARKRERRALKKQQNQNAERAA